MNYTVEFKKPEPAFCCDEFLLYITAEHGGFKTEVRWRDIDHDMDAKGWRDILEKKEIFDGGCDHCFSISFKTIDDVEYIVMTGDDVGGNCQQPFGAEVTFPFLEIRDIFLAAIDKAVKDGFYLEEGEKERHRDDTPRNYYSDGEDLIILDD